MNERPRGLRNRAARGGRDDTQAQRSQREGGGATARKPGTATANAAARPPYASASRE